MIKSDEKPGTYQMFVNIFGGKDSPFHANYAVKRTASDVHRKFDEAAATCVYMYFY